MSLTVTEKNHWKERISRKVDQAIEQLLSGTDPGLMERISHQAKQSALESLQLAQWYQRLDELHEQETTALKERQKVYKAMVTHLTKVPESKLPGSYYTEPREIQDAVKRRQSLHEEQLLADDPLGRKILALRREKEELLDTVWLATSGKQIKHLWSRVNEVLDQQPTPLQQEALTIEPVEGE